MLKKISLIMFISAGLFSAISGAFYFPPTISAQESFNCSAQTHISTAECEALVAFAEIEENEFSSRLVG